MPTIDSLRMLLGEQLKNICDAEKRLTKATVSRIEQAFRELDESPRAKTCAAQRVEHYGSLTNFDSPAVGFQLSTDVVPGMSARRAPVGNGLHTAVELQADRIGSHAFTRGAQRVPAFALRGR